MLIHFFPTDGPPVAGISHGHNRFLTRGFQWLQENIPTRSNPLDVGLAAAAAPGKKAGFLPRLAGLFYDRFGARYTRYVSWRFLQPTQRRIAKAFLAKSDTKPR